MKLEVGQRIDIFKVVTDDFTHGPYKKGDWGPEVTVPYGDKKTRVYLYTGAVLMPIAMGLNDGFPFGKEVVKVGTMVVKKLKNHATAIQ